MGCHIFDTPYWALDLRYPTRVTAEAPLRPLETAPPWSTVRYEFPARDEQPPVTLTWYDGGKFPPGELFDGDPPRPGSSGSVLVGTKGRLVVNHGRGRSGTLLPAREFAGFTPPEPTLSRPKSHHHEWIEACKTGAPTGTNFDYAAALTETVLLGNVALHSGREITWDAEKLRPMDGPLDDPYIRRDYRAGWSL